MIKQGQWVQVKSTILQPHERAPQVPEDTRKTPLIQWLKGSLLDEHASLGQMVTIKTRTGRLVKGILVKEQPSFTHSFGQYIKELQDSQDSIRQAFLAREDRP